MTESVTSVQPGSVIGYHRELKEITGAIERSGSGAPSHVAVIAEPMGGRTAVVNEVRRLYGDRVHTLTLDGVMTRSAMPDFSAISQEIILIDNCEFLATRQFGGFDLLEDFLKAQITSKKLFIATWNLYAWQYLNAIMNIDAYYPTVITLPKLDTPVIKQVILSRYRPGDIQFIDEGTTESSKFFSVVHRIMRLPFSDMEISIPWIKLNFTVMRSRLPGERRVQVSIEDVIFEKINRIADGNPGVALQLWDGSVRDNTISLSAIHESICALSPDINESFILSLILSMKSLHYKDLSAIAGKDIDIDQVLYRLLQQGLIQDTGGSYCISPPFLKCVVEYLKKTRRLW